MGEVDVIRLEAIFLLLAPAACCFKFLIEFYCVVLLGIAKAGRALPLYLCCAGHIAIRINKLNSIILAHAGRVASQV